MKGISKAARLSNDRSQRCKICPFQEKCTPGVDMICHDNFIEGFKKGVAWAKKQLKEK